MYALLIFWFFCIALCSLANILLVKLPKPSHEPVKADNVDLEDTDEPDVTEPVIEYPKTGKARLLS
jgi:hypothetical protein